MTALAPTHQVFAFSQPKIKGGDLAIAFQSEHGPFALRGRLKFCRDFAESILIAIDGPRTPPPPLAPPAEPAKHDRRKDKLPPDKREAYVSAYRFWQSNDLSQREVAKKFGITLFGWLAWIGSHRAELDAPAAPAPVVKPSGSIP